MISPLTYQASQARIEDLHRRGAELQRVEREGKTSARIRFAGMLAPIRSLKARRAPSWQPAAKKA
jgi:hypothetical protein